MWRWLGGARKRALSRLADDIEDHLEHEVQLNVARGMTLEEAHRQARLAFGNVALVREDTRAVWTWAWLEQGRQDARYALRTLRKSPGFAAVALLTLSLGIGANTAIFTLINALMLRALPVPRADQLLQVSMTPGGAAESALSDSLSYPVVRALADQRDLFDGVGGFSTFNFDAGPPENVRRTSGAFVSGAFFETMGIVPAAGRLLTRDDDEIGAPLAAVITDGYWERAFARDPNIMSRPYRVNGQPVVIVGVTRPSFTGAQVAWASDVTLPISAITRIRPELSSLLGPGNIWLRVLARPRAGISHAQIEAGLAARWSGLSAVAVAPTFSAERRASIEGARFTLRGGGTGWTNLRDVFRRPLYVLMTLVGLVMLIACANVAGLLLARATSRHKEIAVRLALGAARGRVVRQLLTESVLLSLASGTAGIYLAQLLSHWLVNMLSTGPLQVMVDVSTDWRVLTFTLVLAVATALLFGLAPAWQATARSPVSALRTVGDNVLRGRLLPSVVTAQVALCLMLLIGAGLFMQTLQNLRAVNTGFEHEGVLLVDVSGQHPRSFYKEALEAVRGVPGVVTASVSTNTPLSGAGWSEAVTIDGQGSEREPAFLAVSPEYFEALRTSLLRGRNFSMSDEGGSPRTAIVNEAFSRRYFPREDALGKHFSATVGSPADLEIAGVVSDVIANDLRGVAPPTVYVPFFQVQVTAQNFSTLQIRTAGPPAALADAIRRSLLPRMLGSPVEIRSLTSQVDSASVRERLMTTLATGLGAIALALAAIGLYGLLAYTVAARSREIGIRVALGANPRSIVALVLRQGVGLAVAGIVIGLAGAAALSRFLEGMLFGLTPIDPTTFAAVSALLAGVALVASGIPARRAARVDPVVSIRSE